MHCIKKANLKLKIPSTSKLINTSLLLKLIIEVVNASNKMQKINKIILFDQNEKAKAGDQLFRVHSSESSVV